MEAGHRRSTRAQNTPSSSRPLPAGRQAWGAPAATLRVALIAIFIALCLASTSTAAQAGIYDPDATPSAEYLIDGGVNGTDGGRDIVMTAATIWVSGYATTATGSIDASLAITPSGTGTPSLFTYDSPFHSTDTADEIALDPRGAHLYTAGLSVDAGGMSDLLVIRWRRSGAVVWARRYDGPAHGPDAAADVAADRRGNVYACGPSAGSFGNDWVIASWSPAGALRWVWRYSGAGHLADEPEEMYVDRDGSVYVTGRVVLAGGLPAALTVKLDSAGRRLWSKTYAGPAGLGADSRAIVACPAGGVYVAGSATQTTGAQDGLVVRYAANGVRRVNELSSTPVEPSSEVLTDVAVASDGTVIGAGWHRRAADPARRLDMRWRADGSWYGTSLMPSAFDEVWTGVATDSFGGVYFSGLAATAATNYDVATIRRPSDYTAGQWSSRWHGPLLGMHVPGGICVRGSTVAVTGACGIPGAAPSQFLLIWRY